MHFERVHPGRGHNDMPKSSSPKEKKKVTGSLPKMTVLSPTSKDNAAQAPRSKGMFKILQLQDRWLSRM